MAINIDKNIKNQKESLLTPGEKVAKVLLSKEKEEEKPKKIKETISAKDKEILDKWTQESLIWQFGVDGVDIWDGYQETKNDIALFKKFDGLRERQNNALKNYENGKFINILNNQIDKNQELKEIKANTDLVNVYMDDDEEPWKKGIIDFMSTDEEKANLHGYATKEQMAMNPAIIDPIDDYWDKVYENWFPEWLKRFGESAVGEESELIDFFNHAGKQSLSNLHALASDPTLTVDEKKAILSFILTQKKDAGWLERLAGNAGHIWHDFIPYATGMFANPALLIKKLRNSKHAGLATGAANAAFWVEGIRTLYIEALLSDTPPKDFASWWDFFIDEGAATKALKQGSKSAATMFGFAYGGPKALQLAQWAKLPTLKWFQKFPIEVSGSVLGWTSMHTLIEGEMPTKENLLDIALLAKTFKVAEYSIAPFSKKVINYSKETGLPIKKVIQNIKDQPHKFTWLFDLRNKGEWLPTLGRKNHIKNIEARIEMYKEIINNPKKTKKSVNSMQKQLEGLKEKIRQLRHEIKPGSWKEDNMLVNQYKDMIKDLHSKIKEQENINFAPARLKKAYEDYTKATGKNPKQLDMEMLEKIYQQEKAEKTKTKDYIDEHKNPRDVKKLFNFDGGKQSIYRRIKDGHPVIAFWTAMLDNLHPQRKASQKYNRYGERIFYGNTVYEQFRLQRGMGQRAYEFIFSNTLDFKTLRPNGKGLKDAFEGINTWQDLKGITYYMSAKYALLREKEGIRSGIRKYKEWKDQLDKIIKDAPPRYKKAEKEFQAFNKRLLTYLKDAGLLDKKTFDRLKDRYYLPFERIKVEDLAPGAKIKSGKPFKRSKDITKGKIEQINNPLEIVAHNVLALIELAEFNVAKTMLFDQVKADKKNGTMVYEVERITGAKEKANINEKIKKEKQDSGELIVEIKGYGKNIQSYHQSTKYGTGNDISYMRNGKLETWRWKDKQMAQAIRDTISAGYPSSLILNILGIPTKILRAGSILNFLFMLKNFFRDTMFAPLVSKNWLFIPGYSSLKGMYKYAAAHNQWMPAHAKYVKEWGRLKVSGGMQGMLKDVDRIMLKKGGFTDALLRTNKKGITARNIMDFANPKNWLEHLRTFAEIFEVGTRWENFSLTQRRLYKRNEKFLKKGEAEKILTEKEILEKSGFEARDVTIDFAKIGSKMKVMNKVAAFLNPTIQGIIKPFENIIWAKKGNFRDPAALNKLVVLGMAYITVPALLEWWTHKDDPLWRSQNTIAKQTNNIFTFKIGEEEIVIHIPRAHNVGYLFGYVPMEIADQTYLRYLANTKDELPEAWQNKEAQQKLKLYIDAEIEPDYLWNILKGWMEQNIYPLGKGFLPDAIRVPVQDFDNFDFYRGNALLNKKQEGIPNVYQRHEYTSPTAIEISEFLDKYLYDGKSNVHYLSFGFNLNSPAKLDMWINGYTSTLGRIFVDYVTDPIVLHYDPGKEEYLINPDSDKWIKNLHKQPIINAFIKRNHTKSTLYLTKFWEKYGEYRKYAKLFDESFQVTTLKDRKLYEDFQNWSKERNNISLAEAAALFNVMENASKILLVQNKTLKIMQKLDEEGKLEKAIKNEAKKSGDIKDEENAEYFLMQKSEEIYIHMNNVAGQFLSEANRLERKMKNKILQEKELRQILKEMK